MAVILPLLVLLLVLAVDLGRVLFSWVGVHNAARIGADYAASHPLDGDWSDQGDPNTEAYVERMLADAAAIGCELPDPLPLPTFPEGTTPGDTAVVELTCAFSPITPIVGALVGAPLDIAAAATFPVRKGIVGMPGAGGGGGGEDDPLCRTVPDLSGMVGSDAEATWATAAFSGAFAISTGTPDGIVVENSQITNPASMPGGCITYKATVSVETADAPTCPVGEALVPQVTGLLVAVARDRWEANFANFEPPAGTVDDDVVTAWTTTPEFSAGSCAPLSTSITVEHDTAPATVCEVPDFIGSQSSAAQATWQGAGFTTTVELSKSGNFKIGKQSINAHAPVTCDSLIVLEPGGGR